MSSAALPQVYGLGFMVYGLGVLGLWFRGKYFTSVFCFVYGARILGCSFLPVAMAGDASSSIFVVCRRNYNWLGRIITSGYGFVRYVV